MVGFALPRHITETWLFPENQRTISVPYVGRSLAASDRIGRRTLSCAPFPLLRLTMQVHYVYAEETFSLGIEPENGDYRVQLPDGSEHVFSARALCSQRLQITTGQRVYRVALSRTERGIEVSCAGRTFVFTPARSPRTKNRRASATGSLVAPMVGVVAEVLVTEGQAVDAYQPLCIVEAMKVMATVDAPFAGIVKKVLVEKGQRVAHGELLVQLESQSG
jgi:biotin carboxyl carrier protein